MKKLVYKFLDEYVGDGVVCKTWCHVSYNAYNPQPKNKVSYSLHSNKLVLILFFEVFGDGEKIAMFRGELLCNTLSGYFGFSSDDAMKYVREWFADKYDMKKVSDLLKFIPTPSS